MEEPLLPKFNAKLTNTDEAVGQSKAKLTNRNAKGEARKEEEEEPLDWLWRPLSTVQHNGKRTLPFSLGNICLWYICYFGVFFNMVLFVTEVMQEGSAQAANDTNNWLGAMFLASLAGAVVAELYLGRLWSCTVFQTIALLGSASTTVATVFLVSGPGSVLSRETASTMFYISIYVMSIGCGGLQSTLQAIGADQFDDEVEKATFFTRYLVLNNMGIALADTVIVYIVNVKGWVWGFGASTVAGVAGLLLFACGMPLYRQFGHKKKLSSQAVVMVAKTIWKTGSSTKGSNSTSETDSTAIKDDALGLSDSVTAMEEVKGILCMLPVWASTIFFNTIYAQAGTLFVEEGATMNTSIAASSIAMAPASMNMFAILTIVLAPCLYDAGVVPVARYFTKHPRGLSPLHRIAVGYILSFVALCLAAGLESLRLRCVAMALPPPSIFWQVPQFMLLGAAQFLGQVGECEFFYTHSPCSLRSLGSALYLTCAALGDYASSILLSVVAAVSTWNGGVGWIPADLDEGHLDYYFWVMAGLAILNLAFFVGAARRFVGREQQHSRQ